MQLFGAIGLAALGTIATDHTKALSAAGHALPSALTGGYHLAYIVAASCVGLGILAAFLILRPPAGTVAQELDVEEERMSSELSGRSSRWGSRHERRTRQFQPARRGADASRAAGVVSEMARSLHRDARNEREQACRAHRSRSSARLTLPLAVFGSSAREVDDPRVLVGRGLAP